MMFVNQVGLTIQNKEKTMKQIILLTMIVFLSSCSNNVLKDTEDKFIEVTDVAYEKNNLENFNNEGLLYDTDAKIFNEAELQEHNIAINSFYHSGVNFVLYFAYDDYEVDTQTTQTIIKHANFMTNNPNIALRLEGHADARGTREYNLALAENRALSIKEILDLYGLENQIEVISFGEEMPKSNENNEQGWQQNRRVEFIYK